MRNTFKYPFCPLVHPTTFRSLSKYPIFGSFVSDLSVSNKSMDELTYLEFFTIYCYSRKLRKSMQNKPREEGRTWWKVRLPNGVEVYVVKRQRPDECIVRMNMLFASAGEIYYLRLLLNHLSLIHI